MTKEIFLAGGCFWGVEEYFSRLPGVVATQVGYANGAAPGPVSYEQVCAGSGHVEALRLVYDQSTRPLRFYLEKLFDVIDPLAVDRQGPDVGRQYRTGVYWTDPADRTAVELELATLQRRHRQPIAVEAGPLVDFQPAEDRHQRYLQKNPGGYCHISPAKLAAASADAAAVDAAQPGRAAPRQPPAFADAAAAVDASATGSAAPRQPPASADAVAAVDASATGRADPRQPPAEHRAADPARLARLTPTQAAVTQQGATEPPFTGEYDQFFEPGLYVDVTSGQPLFVSSQKYDSGCGWPAFSRPIPEALVELEDRSYGRLRTEVRSAGSGAHLGHVFEDGPPELGGLRYCVNSAALEFIPKDQMAARGYAQHLPLVN
ncbi:MAG: peptide-methionine (R)-S-oxide reductase MsrB [Bifidobacteriaceae bacterium]|jgi:peptide methionine sulfoxide reductase msrA/msrB|nr:peptide-methionine (R)-S-oxide reductase MsrB [Bifidobacteriaceae bacterium]